MDAGGQMTNISFPKRKTAHHLVSVKQVAPTTLAVRVTGHALSLIAFVRRLGGFQRRAGRARRQGEPPLATVNGSGQDSTQNATVRGGRFSYANEICNRAYSLLFITPSVRLIIVR